MKKLSILLVLLSVVGMLMGQVVFFDGFEEGNTHDTAIVGWTQEGVAGSNNWVSNNTNTSYNRTPRTGNWNATLRYGNTRWMFREVNLTAGTEYNLTFYARQDGAVLTNSNIEAQYGSAANAESMTLPIIPETGLTNGDYQMFTGNFTPENSGTFYIGIKGFMNSSPWYISIDDISLLALEDAAPAPASLVSPLNEATSVMITQSLSWNPGIGNAPTGYKMYFGTSNPPTTMIDLGDVTTWSPVPALAYSETYYWQVVPYNDEGDAEECPVWSFTTMDDPTIVSFPYNENFDTTPVQTLPLGWTRIVQTTSTGTTEVVASTLAPTLPNALRLANSGDANAVIIAQTPPIQDINTKRAKFYIRGAAVGYDTIIGTTNDTTDPEAFTPITSLVADGNFAYHIVPLTGATGNHLAFKHGLGGTWRTIFIDDLTIEEIPNNAQYMASADSLSFGSVYFNRQKYVSYNVANTGMLPLTLTYTLPAEISMESTTITIPVGQSETIQFMFTPAVEGDYVNTIELTTNDPEVLTVSIPVTAEVLPALPEGLVEIGDGVSNALNLPINPYFGYNYSQTIYLQNEIDIPDNQISKLYFYWNGVEAGTVYKDWIIYIGHTDSTHFASNANWLPQADLVEVFDGEVDIPAEEGWVEIILNTPFVYNNTQNLVVAVNEVTPGYGNSNAKFLGTATPGVNRALRVQRDSPAAYDVTDLPATGTLVAGHANIRMQFIDLPTNPVISVNPMVKNYGMVEINTVSAAQTFTISNLGTGTLDVTAIALSGINADQFVLTNNNNLPSSVSAGENITVTVAFAPTSAGEKAATLLITDNLTREVTEVTLTGICFDPIISELPWLEDFNAELFPPLHWTIYSGILSDSTDMTPVTGIWQHHKFGNIVADPNNSAYINIYGTRNHWLVTPPINLDAVDGNKVLEFDIALTPWTGTTQSTLGPDDYVAVVISTDNGVTWSNENVLISWDASSVILPTGNSIIVSLEDYAGIVKIGFYAERPTGFQPDLRFYVDNVQVSVGDMPTFNPPTNLVATAGDGVVDLAWEAPVVRTLNGYRVYRNGTAITGVIEGLTYSDATAVNGTTYEYYVTAVYSIGESVPSNTVEATPQGQVEILPPANLTANVVGNNVHLNWQNPYATQGESFYEGFEGTTLPAGWQNLDVDGDGNAWFLYNVANAAHSGNQCIASASWTSTGGALNPNNWLITPAITLDNNSVLSWWAGAQDPAWPQEHYEVKISTTGSLPANFTTSLFNETLTNGIWQNRSVDLSAYSGQTVYIAFIHNNCTDWFYLKLDDIEVTNVLTGRSLFAANFETEEDFAKFTTASVTNSQYSAKNTPVSNTLRSSNNLQRVQTRELQGFKVYRDSELIATLDANTTSYIDASLDYDTYIYEVTTLFAGEESDPASVEVTVSETELLLPPRNLTANVTGNNVALSWQEPGITGGWFTHALLDEYNNSIGTGQPSEFTVVQRFSPAQLAAFGVAGAQLTKVRFMPNFAAAEFTVKVWTGGSGSPLAPGTLVAEQVVGTAPVQVWKEVILNTPVNIPVDQELWIGYHLTTTGGHPAGCDAGPVVEGYGNVMYFNNSWTTLTALNAGLTFNWMIKGLAEVPGSVVAFSSKDAEINPAIEETVVSRNIYSDVVWSLANDNLALRSNNLQRTQERALLGYNVYRNETLLTASPITALTYTDTNAPNGIHTYHVTSVYDGGESVPASVSVTVGTSIVDTFPWSEGFEGAIFPPFGWSMIDQDGDGHDWFAYTAENSAHTGVKSAASASWQGNPLFPNNWLITPAIQLPTTGTGQSMWLKYYIAAQDPDRALEHYSVMISTSGTQVGNFTSIFNETLSSVNWAERSIELSAYEGQTVYIAFRHHNVTDMFLIKLDDVWVGTGTSTSDLVTTPLVTSLSGNYPNPFNPETVIKFSVAQEGPVTLEVFNIKGQKVKTLVNDNMSPGHHQVVWTGNDDNGRQVGSGMYFYRMKSGKYTSTKKMILMK